MRVACLLVADLPLAAEVRAQPELGGAPLAIAAGPGPRASLVAVSGEAARLGVRTGSSVAQARSVCADLVVRVASPALARAARDALLDAALSATPRAALAPPTSGAFAAEAAAHADASGVQALHGSEAGFAGALVERARRVGLPAVAAIASSRAIARLAARTLSGAARARGGETLVLPRGAEAAFLAPLSVDLLDPDDALADALTRFGVRSIGELARLPRRALAARLGPEALRLADLARGEGPCEPLPPPPPPRAEEALELEAPVDRLEALAFALRGLLSRLVARLELRGLACADLELELALDGGGRDARRVGVSSPTGDLRVLLRLACLALEARPPEAPVVGIRLASEGRPPRRDQLDLFRSAGPAPAVLDRTLAELEALCGPGRVGSPCPADDHHPDAFHLGAFASGASEPPEASEGGVAGRRPTQARVGLAARVFRPPLPARVRERGGRPEWIESAVLHGPILAVAGPWRTSGGWWSAEGRFALDQFDVQTADGGVARLRFDRLTRAWAVDAIYD
jgi:protein ImuB